MLKFALDVFWGYFLPPLPFSTPGGFIILQSEFGNPTCTSGPSDCRWAFTRIARVIFRLLSDVLFFYTVPSFVSAFVLQAFGVVDPMANPVAVGTTVDESTRPDIRRRVEASSLTSGTTQRGPSTFSKKLELGPGVY